jgi:hypothetical protein
LPILFTIWFIMQIAIALVNGPRSPGTIGLAGGPREPMKCCFVVVAEHTVRHHDVQVNVHSQRRIEPLHEPLAGSGLLQPRVRQKVTLDDGEDHAIGARQRLGIHERAADDHHLIVEGVIAPR